jgi:subtilisin family serine protease
MLTGAKAMRTSSRVVVTALMLNGLAGLAGGQPAQPRPEEAAMRPNRVVHLAAHTADEVIVRFKDHVAVKDMVAAHAWARGEHRRRFRSVPNLRLVKVAPGMSVKEVIARYRQHPDVLYAEPNYIVRSMGLPSDPRFGDLWGLQNVGQSGGTPGADIDTPGAWGITTGSNDVVVAVIDSGIDYTHEDLAANMFRNEADCNANGVDDDGNGFVDDCFGVDTLNNDGDPMDDNSHGTHVAGTIGAVGDNGVGVAGVNWNVRLLGCKFLGADGRGPISAAIACLDYVKTMKDRGVNIVATNNSWGGGAFSQALHDVIEAHRQRGILFIAAAGNGGSDGIGDSNDTTPFFPASYNLPNVIAVASTDHTDNRSPFSNFGRHTVHVGAPGSQIWSTVPGNRYASYSGTSMATPHVTGLAALLKAQDPGRDGIAIRNLILAGGDPISALATNTVTGRRINALESLSCVNRTVVSRLRPLGSTVIGQVGVPIDLSALHINCVTSNGPVMVTVTPGDEAVLLQDDGAETDRGAGDGIYSGRWTPLAAGTHTLTFPDGDVVTAQISAPYRYASAPFVYRTIDGTSLNLGDDWAAAITSPFPIAFGGNGNAFTTVYISSNGNVNFTGFFPQFSNAALPTSRIATLVAPFWDDLYPFLGTAQNVFWAVTGSEPNRELVIEWRDLRHYFCPGSVRFQVVFFEGRSDVLFNYAHVTFGGGCFADRGASATVGIQSGPNGATQFSSNAPSLHDSTALLWTIPPPAISVTPGLHAFGEVPVGTTLERTFTVRNVGGGTVTGAASTTVPFRVIQGGSFSLREGQSQAVTVRFSPAVVGTFAAAINFTSNAGSVSRSVTGTGGPPANPAPVIRALSPGSGVVGGSSFTLTVIGSDFAATSIVRWNGSDRATTFLNSSQLQAAIPANDLASAGTAAVTVFTPASGGGTSNVVSFSITGPAPSIAVTPASGRPGPFTVTLTNWAGGASDWLGLAPAGAPNTTYLQWVYANYLPVSGGARVWSVTVTAPGSYEVRLFANSGYTRIATSPPFTVTTIGPTPSIAVTPASGRPGPFTVTLTNWAGGASDWLGLAPAGAPNTTYLQWVYANHLPVSGGARVWSVTVTAPGSYEVRLFANNGYTRTATSPPFTVTPSLTVAGLDQDRTPSKVVRTTITFTPPRLAEAPQYRWWSSIARGGT